MEEQRGKGTNMNKSNLHMISLGGRQTDNIYLMITLSQGLSNFFVQRPFLSNCKISATLKCHKVLKTKGNWAILVDFGDP